MCVRGVFPMRSVLHLPRLAHSASFSALTRLDAGRTLTAAAVMFAIGFVLFWRGVFGGGDAKLVSAMALLVGHREVVDFLILMSLCGGVLALAIVARDICVRFWPLRCGSRLSSEIGASGGPPKSTVPYGVAIAAAGVITLMLAK